MNNSIKEGIDRYVNHRIPTGAFLEAVLSNDLKGAFGRADEDNRRDLFEIVSYCYNEIPGDCWGSPERVSAWLKQEDAPAEPSDERDDGVHAADLPDLDERDRRAYFESQR